MDDVLVHFAETCAYGREFRSTHTAGDGFFGFFNFLIDELTGKPDVHIVVKHDRYHGQSEAGNRAHFHEVGQVGKAFFNGVSDELLYLLGSKRWAQRDDLNLVIGNVRYRVYR